MATITMSETEVVRRTTTGDRFVAVALFIVAAVSTALMLLAGEALVFWLIPAAVYVILGLTLLWRAPRWLLIVAIVIPVLQITTSLPFTIPGLTHPETPASFLPEWFIIIASLTAIVGAAMALPRGERSRRTLGLVAGVLAIAATLTSVIAYSGVESVTQQPGDVPVTAVDVAYPQRVEVGQGGALFVQNDDPVHHTFVVEGTGIHTDLAGRSAVRIDADLPPGTYRFFCDVPGHETMQGALIVQ